MELSFLLAKVDILSFVLIDTVKMSWKNGLQFFSGLVKGERIWLTPVKIVER
jgi:hypothetical protein